MGSASTGLGTDGKRFPNMTLALQSATKILGQSKSKTATEWRGTNTAWMGKESTPQRARLPSIFGDVAKSRANQTHSDSDHCSDTKRLD